ncbi:MAG: DUF5606 domain-containing protein [Bacteroidota bacterium]
MEFSDLASVSGKGGLFKVISPTRNGVILEALDEGKKKFIAGMRTKVSVLSDISIYTTDGDGSTPLESVMKKIHEEFDGDTGLSGASDSDELKSFLKHILPNYDDSKVYVSDIKKLVNWYNIISKDLPDLLVYKAEPAQDEPNSKETKGADEDEKSAESEQ